PPEATVEVESIPATPRYDADVDAKATPSTGTELTARLATAAAALPVAPEYNASTPGAFKNAIDWLTRPPADIARVFKGRAVGLIGASPGMRGTVLSQTAWLPVLRTLGVQPWFEQLLYVGNADKVFDPSGKLIDDAIRMRLRNYVRGFVEFAGSLRQGRQ